VHAEALESSAPGEHSDARAAEAVEEPVAKELAMTRKQTESIFEAVQFYPLPEPHHSNIVRALRQWQRGPGAQPPESSDPPPPLPDDLFGMAWLYFTLNGQPLVRPARGLTH
jgi:hypothetical protein